jgi:hypothetical protein
MPSILEGVFSSSEDELNKMLLSLVGMPKAEIEAELSIIKSRVEEVAQTIPTKGNKGDKGDKGDQGIQGPKGEPGREGRDGYQGKDGKQGVDGKDGIDGANGVSIVDVNVAFDNHLVITLSDGTEIDAGVIGDLSANLQNVVANYVSKGANGTLIYKGLWNASTNTPTLSLLSSDASAYYVVSVAGNTNLSGITDWQVNDWIIFNGTEWQKIDNSDLFNASAVAITGGAIDGTTIGSTTATTGKFTSVTTPSVTATTNDLTLSAISTGVVNVNTLNGTQFRVNDSFGGGTSAAYWNAYGATAQPRLRALSSSNAWVETSGTGSLVFATNSGVVQQVVSHTASAVNYVQVTGASTTGSPSVSALGSDATINFDIAAKGGGEIRFKPNGNTTAVNFAVGFTANTINYLTATGSGATGNAPRLYAQGTDTNISMAFQPKGTGAIDLAAGSRGVNISNGGTVTAITVTTSGVTAYTSHPTPAITAPTTAGGVTATATSNLFYNSALASTTIVNGGTGYTVGNSLTVSGGTFTAQALFTVTAVSSGVVTAIQSSSGGTYSAIPTGTLSVTGGSGTGFTFTINGWAVRSLNITNAGSGYIEQPTITFSGGGGSGAAAYATVGSGTVIRSLANTLDIHTPAGSGFQVNNASGSTLIYSKGVTGYGGFLASSITGNSAFYFGYVNNAEVGRISMTSSNNLSFGTSSAASEQMRVSHTASAVNYVQVTGNSTGNPPIISAQGSDSNITLSLASKSGGSIRFTSNGGANIQCRIVGTNAAVNNFTITGTTAGNAPTFGVEGTDTNIDLALTPKGTGLVRFGTYVAGALLATGYINIKAADGTTYKVLVST